MMDEASSCGLAAKRPMPGSVIRRGVRDTIQPSIVYSLCIVHTYCSWYTHTPECSQGTHALHLPSPSSYYRHPTGVMGFINNPLPSSMKSRSPPQTQSAQLQTMLTLSSPPQANVRNAERSSLPSSTRDNLSAPTRSFRPTFSQTQRSV